MALGKAKVDGAPVLVIMAYETSLAMKEAELEQMEEEETSALLWTLYNKASRQSLATTSVKAMHFFRVIRDDAARLNEDPMSHAALITLGATAINAT